VAEQPKVDAPPSKADESLFGWGAARVTEISALASMAAFVCGIAYDQAFLSSFDTRLLNILSIHDSISTGITFLPQIALLILFSNIFAYIMDKDTRRRLATLFLVQTLPILVWLLKPFKKTRERVAINVYGRSLGESLIFDVQNEYSEKVKKERNLLHRRLRVAP
jgi:hypothetical protein